MPNLPEPALRRLSADVFAGLTVALVAIPQCMAFATIAGLPPVTGLYSAVVMGLASALISASPWLVVGPVITASSMCLGVLRLAAPDRPAEWPEIAATLALLVGIFTILGALLNVGRFVRFVSRSVIVGLIAGSALLTIGSQLAAALGVTPSSQPMLIGILWSTVARTPEVHWPALIMSLATLLFVLAAGRIGPKFPAAFVALVLSGVAVALLDRAASGVVLKHIGNLPWEWPAPAMPWYSGPYQTDLVVGAAAIALVGIIQSLAIAKGLGTRNGEVIDSKRELWALGVANIASGFSHGFPGSGSFARSALCDLAGARTRLSGIIAAGAIAIIAVFGASLTCYITHAAIAGLLIATAISMVDWHEFVHVLRHDRYDRIVLGTTILCVFFLPIHWAVLIGLAVSIAVFLRRVSELHLFEMVAGDGQQFVERSVDDQTGRSAVTMLQIEGPLFFAHADELADRLRAILRRVSTVLIIRMRRTKHVDFSVLGALDRVLRDYLERGGRVVICGLQPELRAALRESPLGETIPPEYMLETTREVFGSAHMAIALAENIARLESSDGRPLYRLAQPA